MKNRLLIDTNYLCWRAYYTTGELSSGNVKTGILYGILRDIIDLQDRFQPDCFCFCFDKGTSLRKADYPAYKSNRTRIPEVDEQIKAIRLKYLPQLGYRNIFAFKGYEADDCIAKLSLQRTDNNVHNYIIVSGDHDMYQLLGRGVEIYHPASKRHITEDSFSKLYGLSPLQWIDCKSIAGCKTDCVEGIKGVAEKTAAKFINGKLSPISKSFKAIVEGNEKWRSNRHLIRLPYPGLPELEVRAPEELKKGSWHHLAKKLDMKSIMDREPVQKKRGLGIV